MASWTGDLSVRLVRAGERARFGQLLEAHHWLGSRLFGSVNRHVAVLDGEWVALLGYGSAVLRCTARDQVIGWPDADRVDRLPMLAGNQRFCVLPGARRPHLASAVLARSLARLAGDFLAVHNQIVLAAETFTDPARHAGSCYAAAGWAVAGPTSGYRRAAGGARVCLPRPGQAVLAAGGARRRAGRAGGAGPVAAVQPAAADGVAGPQP